MSWQSAINKAHQELVTQRDTRELGKIRQHANEHVVQEWLNGQANGWGALRHHELPSSIDSDHNCGSWDMMDPSSGLRIQAKYRAGKSESNRWHMEQTRRASGANSSKSRQGQVRYEEGEFDVMIFTSPPQISEDFVPDRDLIAIPASELKDPKNPGLLVGRVPPVLVKKWAERNPLEVINEVRNKMIKENE